MNVMTFIIERKSLLVAITLLMVLVSNLASAAGLLKPKQDTYNDLQIVSHHVEVMIADGYATTQVEQVFRNPNNVDLEAIYSFPVPSKAAVGEFSYWIDGVAVTGEVLEKQQAREVYAQQKAQGNETALVEQDKHKTFDMSVYPVRANDEVKVRLVYVQPTHTDTGVGRYLYPLEAGGVDEAKMQFWTRNESVEESFQFKLTLRSNYPIDGLRLPNHPNAVVSQPSPEEYVLELSNQANAEEEGSGTPSTQVFSLDQDIIAYWRHTPGLPGAMDMVAYKESAESTGTFFITLTPAMDLKPLQQGRDWVFVLDISGSMQGKYNTLVEGVRQALGKLNSADRFRVVLFNNRTQELTQGYTAATAANVAQVLQQLDQTRPNQGTNLYAGLERGLAKLDSDRATGLVLVTDGVANVGVTEKKEFLKLMEKSDVRLFCFIMGNESNRPLLEGMTKVSQGFYQEVSNADDMVGQLMLATGKLSHEALRDVEVEIDGVRVKDLTPETIGSLYHGQQLHLLGHYWKGGEAKVRIKGKIGGRSQVYNTTIEFPETDTRYPEIERVWAYAAIEALLDKQDYFGEDADTRQAVVDIAKSYSLVTDYTSMIVVREEVFQQLGLARNNKQRVEKERKAREDRAQQAVQNHRVDAQAPLFQGTQPSVGNGNSGGAFGNVFILLMLPLMLWLRRRRQ
jgi:Ca-activated chloride channel family protein